MRNFILRSLLGDSSKIAVSQYEVRKAQREVLTKHANAGQETVVATEPRKRDGGSLDRIIVDGLRKASEQNNSAGRLLGVLAIGRDGCRYSLDPRLPSIRSLGAWWRGLGWRHPIPREPLSEIRSCYRRIRLLCKRGQGTSLRMGRASPVRDPEGLIPNTTRHGRIQSKERLLSACHWASLRDQQLFLCGWEMGR